MYLLDLHSCIEALANTFSSFVRNKSPFALPSAPAHAQVCWILLIPENAQVCWILLIPENAQVCWILLIPEKVVQNLTCATGDEVSHLLTPCKSSASDPIPTSLMKDCMDILVTPTASMVYLSLSIGSFPSHFQSIHFPSIDAPLSLASPGILAL